MKTVFEGLPPLMASVTAADHRRGGETPRLFVVEYGDYLDAASRAAHLECERLRSHFGGSVCFVYRHFPRSHFEPSAAEVAEAAEAAGGQGKFWEMHDCLYSRSGGPVENLLLECAALVGLDVLRFLRDVSGRKYSRKVRRDYLGGVRSGVVATPAFFVGGERHTGLSDFSSLRSAVERAQEGGRALTPKQRRSVLP